MSRSGASIMVFWSTVIMCVIADQATKVAVRHIMPLGSPSRTLIPYLVDVLRVENTGAAFSIGQGATWLFVGCAIVAFIVALRFVCTCELPMPIVLALGCVAGGGMGNMVDRLVQGSVTDFLALSFINFPVFNVADIFVTCGTLACCVLYLRWESQQDIEDGVGDSSHAV
jgi:signal peptidase II